MARLSKHSTWLTVSGKAWSSILRRGCAGLWIRFFKNVRDCGLSCDDGVVVQAECLIFFSASDLQ